MPMPMTVRKPAATKHLANYLNWQIELSGKKQYEIAEICEFDKPNMITMIKQGKTKLPFEKIGKMAKALELDPKALLLMAYKEYRPAELEIIEGIIGQPMLADNEIEIVEVFRNCGIADPKLRPAEKARLREFAAGLRSEGKV